MMLPNSLIRSYLNALEDLLGKNGVNTIINHSGLSDWVEQYPPEDETKAVPFESFAKLQTSLEDIYGDRTAHNLSRRAARASLGIESRDLLKLDLETSTSGGSTDKIKAAMNAFISLFDDGSDAVEWSSTADEIIISYSRCPDCVDRESQDPICFSCVGWIEGLVDLLKIGDNIEVIEAACLAAGDNSCSFTIKPG